MQIEWREWPMIIRGALYDGYIACINKVTVGQIINHRHIKTGSPFGARVTEEVVYFPTLADAKVWVESEVNVR